MQLTELTQKKLEAFKLLFGKEITVQMVANKFIVEVVLETDRGEQGLHYDTVVDNIEEIPQRIESIVTQICELIIKRYSAHRDKTTP